MQRLGSEAVAAYKEVEALIEATDLSGMPISPIDHIRSRIEEAGYSFGELTGRDSYVEYDAQGQAYYQRRTSKGNAHKIKVVDGFNNGKIDVLLGNETASTGISAHASEKFADQRRRELIVGQAQKDVNKTMQFFGRVNRTGQVVPPIISIVLADTPDEKRPAAVLMKKMASLNANTVAARENGLDVEGAPDFLNMIGDAVATEMMEEYPEINEKLDFPIKVSEEMEPVEDAVAKVTGRLPLLTLKEQEQFYQIFEAEYHSALEQAKALGENPLEAETLDLDARSLARMEILPTKTGINSRFADGVYVEVLDIQEQTKPKTQLEVLNEARRTLGLDPVEQAGKKDAQAVEKAASVYSKTLLSKVGQAAELYMAAQSAQIKERLSDPEKQQAKIDFTQARIEKQQTALSKLNRYQVGQAVRMTTEIGRTYYGVVTGVEKKGKALDDILQSGQTGDAADWDSNPVSPSKWQLKLSVADSIREVVLPLSKVNTERQGAVTLMPVQQTMMGEDVYHLFDSRQSGGREVRQGFTGNLIRAFHKYCKQGKLVNYTDHQGQVKQMLLANKGFDLERELTDQPVELPAVRNIRQFMELTAGMGVVKTMNELITLKQEPSGGNYLLQTGKTHKGVFLDETLLETVGGEFYAISDRMEARFSSSRLGGSRRVYSAGTATATSGLYRSG